MTCPVPSRNNDRNNDVKKQRLKINRGKAFIGTGEF